MKTMNNQQNAPEKYPDAELMRDVDVDDFRLQTWDINRKDHMGKHKIAFRFSSPDGEVLFENEMSCSPIHPIDSDETLRSVMSFLTLRPGDVEDEFFVEHEYTDKQFEFADQHAEELSLYGMDDLEDHPGFKDRDEDDDRPQLNDRGAALSESPNIHRDNTPER